VAVLRIIPLLCLKHMYKKMPVKKCGNFDDPECVHFIDATEQDEEQITIQNITFGWYL
jgi:hypothetical protein